MAARTGHANGVLKGRILDPLSAEYPLELGLLEHRARPVPLDQVGREVTLQLKGKNLAPGSMVYFSSPDVRIVSIQYLTARSRFAEGRTRCLLDGGQEPERRGPVAVVPHGAVGVAASLEE